MLTIEVNPDRRIAGLGQGSANTNAVFIGLCIADDIVWLQTRDGKYVFLVLLCLEKQVYFRQHGCINLTCLCLLRVCLGRSLHTFLLLCSGILSGQPPLQLAPSLCSAFFEFGQLVNEASFYLFGKVAGSQ